jgi:galactose-1-phosphate uridylyltransferase
MEEKATETENATSQRTVAKNEAKLHFAPTATFYEFGLPCVSK